MVGHVQGGSTCLACGNSHSGGILACNKLEVLKKPGVILAVMKKAQNTHDKFFDLRPPDSRLKASNSLNPKPRTPTSKRGVQSIRDSESETRKHLYSILKSQVSTENRPHQSEASNTELENDREKLFDYKVTALESEGIEYARALKRKADEHELVTPYLRNSFAMYAALEATTLNHS
ncbi:uncharacterized protein BDZ99DRAFT_477866 [Mytilinidion resinicola]|uniref:Uncharacterized protein n=1 Tax=Mytilinidion resinicola TaxID=574789 RepID=A0A6A6YIE5_9PEZI|nr:uncharacterized protein BDZ99DRAFT_477866 [Mytilinidion resinicola]KAF2808339.1 hypothetical protein BDZ99DRAFT_477866 [Mytilinidion resinicola]